MAAGPSWATSRPRGRRSLQQHRPGCGAASTLSSTTRTRRRRSAAWPPATALGAAATGLVRVAPGRRTMNSLPLPGPSLVAATRPAVQLDQLLDERQADARGRPASGRASGRPGRTGRRSSGSISGAMPMPVSRDPDDDLVRRRAAAVRRIRPPGSVYLAALVSRLTRTCSSRAGSASSQTGPRGHVDGSARAAARRSSGRTALDGPVEDRSSSTRSLRSSILPRRDPGDVQQVVDQAGQVLDLPLASIVARPVERPVRARRRGRG